MQSLLPRSQKSTQAVSFLGANVVGKELPSRTTSDYRTAKGAWWAQLGDEVVHPSG